MASEDVATRLREAITIVEGSGLSVCTMYTERAILVFFKSKYHLITT